MNRWRLGTAVPGILRSAAASDFFYCMLQEPRRSAASRGATGPVVHLLRDLARSLKKPAAPRTLQQGVGLRKGKHSRPIITKPSEKAARHRAKTSKNTAAARQRSNQRSTKLQKTTAKRAAKRGTTVKRALGSATLRTQTRKLRTVAKTRMKISRVKHSSGTVRRSRETKTDRKNGRRKSERDSQGSTSSPPAADRDREMKLLQAEELMLRRVLSHAKAQLSQALKVDAEVLRLATEPWTLATGGEKLLFSGAALRKSCEKAAAKTEGKQERAAAVARVKQLTSAELDAAAAWNTAARDRIVKALDMGTTLPDPFVVERLKSQPKFTVSSIVGCEGDEVVERLRHLLAHDGKSKREVERAARDEALRDNWFKMNAAIRQHGHAASAASSAIVGMADSFADFDSLYAPASGTKK